MAAGGSIVCKRNANNIKVSIQKALVGKTMLYSNSYYRMHVVAVKKETGLYWYGRYIKW